jgi:hypothetical protein
VRRLSSGFAVLAALLALSATSDAFACACCTDPGERNVTVSKLETAMIEMIEQVEFAKKVDLFTGAGGLESIEGITAPAERYAVKATWEKDRAVFALDDDKDHSGSLSLEFPEKISIFEVDTRDAPNQAYGPALYKEWKLTGKTSGTGAFDAASGPQQRLTLILQGRGNACTSSSDFTHWSLVMEGPKANYLLFGDLVPAP